MVSRYMMVPIFSLSVHLVASRREVGVAVIIIYGRHSMTLAKLGVCVVACFDKS